MAGPGERAAAMQATARAAVGLCAAALLPLAAAADGTGQRLLQTAANATGAPSATPTGFFNDTTASPTVSPTAAPPTASFEEELTAFVQSRGALGIALLCAVLAIAISAFNIFRHLVHYSEPALQKNIVRILFMVPFYALFSFLSLAFPAGRVFLISVRDVYEAFVVYCFLNLMLSYCGGENNCLSVIMHDPGSIRHVWPLGSCLPEMALTSRFLRACKQWTLQFVIIKPVMAALNLFMVASDRDDARGWTITQAIVYNVSYTAALYALLLFYKATHGHPGLKSQYPVLKFLSVKLVVFATYYQSVLVSVIPSASEASLEALNSFLICCEMVLFAALQYCAFSWKEFAPGEGKRRSAHIASRHDSAFDSVGIDMAARPAGGAGAASGASAGAGDKDSALQNARNIISMRDVAKDAYYNFNNKYGDHVLLDSNGTSLDLEHADPDARSGAASAAGNGAAGGKAPPRRSAFGRLGTTVKSLATGGRLGGALDAEPGSGNSLEGANPFQASENTQFPGAGGGDAASAASPDAPRGSMGEDFNDLDLDLQLPGFAAEDSARAAAGLENPFAEELMVGAAAGEVASGESRPPSVGGDAGAAGAAQSSWTADFSDPTPAAARPGKVKKKKRAKKAEAGSSASGTGTGEAAQRADSFTDLDLA